MPLNAKKSLSYHVAQVDLNSNDEKMRGVQQQRLEEQEEILEILMTIVDIELKHNGVVTSTFLTSEKPNEAKSTLFTLRQIIQGANSNISSHHVANS